MNTPIQTLKGFRDFLPNEAKKRQYVIQILKQIFESYGFEPLETPTLEYENILLGKYGEEADKLLYRFEDNGKRRVAMRYDQTVPLARVIAQYQDQLPYPFKRYQIQPVFRAENTQKGRFREFLQCDIDSVGKNNALADAEILSVIVESFQALGFKNFSILLNDRENLRFDTNGIQLEPDRNIKAVRALDKLKKIGHEGVVSELIENGFTKDESEYILQTATTKQPTQRTQEILSYCQNFGILPYIHFSPTLARGLDYYTGMILEVECHEYPSGSLGGGGRYDNLIGMFSTQQVPAVGFAFGFDRVIEAMDALQLFPTTLHVTTILITIFQEQLSHASIDLWSFVRAHNINCELYPDTQSKLEKQLKYADHKKIPYVAIIGEKEQAENTITVKNMATNSQSTVTKEELISLIKTN